MHIKKEHLVDVIVDECTKKRFVKQGIWRMMQPNKSHRHSCNEKSENEEKIERGKNWARRRVEKIQSPILVREKMTLWEYSTQKRAKRTGNMPILEETLQNLGKTIVPVY
jgi:hypothetical protein